MRTLTPTLLAAQRALGGVPSVRVRIEDHELRWSPLLDSESSAWPTAACAVAGAILRARLGPGGRLDVQRITSPGAPAQWQSWTPLLTGLAPASDLALSPLAGDPAKVRLFCLRGSGPYALSCLQSADGGLTWSAPADLLSGLGSAGQGLASANGALFYHDPGDGYLKLLLRAGWASGAWTGSTWTAADALSSRYGLAAAYEAGTYYLATCDEETASVRRLRTGTYATAGGVWSGPLAIMPPGLPAPAFIPRYPSLARAGGLWHLAYLETLAGPLSSCEPTVIHSADWQHWSFACWVPLTGQGGAQRAALVAYDGALYLALEKAVWRASAYDPAAADKRMSEGNLLGYVLEEEPWYGMALVELYNPAGRYRGFGLPGEVGAPLRPLARVIVERGYRTAAGEERIARTPYYLISIALRRGGQRPALRLECEDGWGLLRRWRPDALYLWTDKSLRWLIAELLYRASGLGCTFDGAPAWELTLDTFALAPGDWPPEEGRHAPAEALRSTGYGALRTLLAKVAGAARWQEDGSLHCFIPSAQTLADPYVIGRNGEILDALYARGLVLPTQARVFGEGVAAVAAGLAARGSPRRYLATSVDPHLGSIGACQVRAGGLVQAGDAHALGGWVEAPCLLGLDLYDLVAVQDAQAPFSPADWLRVTRIVERYEPEKGVFVTRALAEGA